MTSLFAIIIFFFIFVVVYLAVTTLLALVSWWLKRRANREGAMHSVDEIERRMDLFKDKAFMIALVLTFFVITPYVVILWVIP